MLVRERMTREVLTVSPTTTIADALAVTRNNAVRHLPVVENGRLVGIITDRDLRLALPAPWEDETDPQRRELRERTVMILVTDKPVMTVEPDILVEDAARKFYENRVGCLPVMEGDRLVGILTASDLLRAFVDVFTAHEKSSRLEIVMPNRPGELARVVRLIGIDYKINITGMVLTPGGEGMSIMTIHVQTMKPEDLIEALEKMGYRVGWPMLK